MNKINAIKKFFNSLCRIVDGLLQKKVTCPHFAESMNLAVLFLDSLETFSSLSPWQLEYGDMS